MHIIADHAAVRCRYHNIDFDVQFIRFCLLVLLCVGDRDNSEVVPEQGDRKRKSQSRNRCVYYLLIFFPQSSHPTRSSLSNICLHFQTFAFLGIAGNVPLETMEQHVFRTYEAKYGLRSIAVEHAGALLRSLLKHSSTDNEVRIHCCVMCGTVVFPCFFVNASYGQCSVDSST